MAEENPGGIKIFGFEIKRASSDKNLKSIVPPQDEDGAGFVTAAGTHFGQYLNLDGDDTKDNHQLIMKYRGIAAHPEVDAAIEDLTNEAVIVSEKEKPCSIVLDNVPVSKSIKNKISEEFAGVVSMLNFTENGQDLFRQWYIDGRLYHHLVVDEANLKAGIKEVRPIDAAKIRKVKQVKKKKDPKTGASLIEKVDEFYIYQEKPGSQAQGLKLSADAISYVTSGLLDPARKKVLSHLHKALKPVNQLRMMEDSLVIYRLSRAPERRIFYIDVGNLPRGKTEQYLKDIMARYRNKLVYDADTGQLKDDRKHMSMLEDFWLPRREGGRGTEISTLPGGENLGQIEDIIYFQKRLYRSLNVPLNRLEQESPSFAIGRSTEINRDELKFQKFIDRLRMRFSHLFLEILRKQLIMKGIVTEEDWNSWKNDIMVDYLRDNHFAELKNMEIMRERLQALNDINDYVSRPDEDGYFSKEWVMKNVLQFTDDDIKSMGVDPDEPPTDGDQQPDNSEEPPPEA